MILPAVGRHETRTGEKPMELITVSHSDSSFKEETARGARHRLPDRAEHENHASHDGSSLSGDVVRTEQICDAGLTGTLAAAGVTACSCIQREVHLLGRGCGSLFLHESSWFHGAMESDQEK